MEEESEYYVYGCSHDLVADHEPCSWCNKCGIAISSGFMTLHQQFKCDNEKVGNYLKKQQRQAKFKR